jgi:cell division septation protein DedD
MLKVLLGAVLLLAVACGTTTTVTSPEHGTTVPTNADPYGDSPAYGGDPFAGFDGIVSVAVPGGFEEASQAEDEPNGRFSVQVAACSTPEAAAGVAAELRGLLEQPVFVDSEGAYHKVRVGSFENREQALALQASVRALGWSDAWVVER